MVINSSRLVALTKGDLGRSEQWEQLTSAVSALLNMLRHRFKQANLSDEVYGISSIDVESIPALEASLFDRRTQGMIRKYLVDTAVDWSSLSSIDVDIPSFSPPIFDTILLDAFRALWRGDNRQAILYAAIAVETLVNTVLKEAYDRLVSSGDISGRFRLLDFTTDGGAKVTKDPVYDALSQRTDFGLLIHERSLYLLGRSVLADNQVLYTKAKKLYTTRNKIVHWGEPSAEHDAYLINTRDAQDAISCAAKVFEYYGSPDYVSISDLKEWLKY